MERWRVFSDFRREPIVGVPQAHLNKWCVSSTNGHVKPWELKPQQKDLMQVLRRPAGDGVRKLDHGSYAPAEPRLHQLLVIGTEKIPKKKLGVRKAPLRQDKEV